MTTDDQRDTQAETEPLTSERLAEIRRRVESAYQPDVFGLRTRLDMAILDSMALLADNDRLHAALAAAEAREAALFDARRERDAAMEVVRAVAEGGTLTLFAHQHDAIGQQWGLVMPDRLNQARALLAATAAGEGEAEAGERFVCPGCGERWRRDQLGPTPNILRCPNCGEFCTPAGEA